MRGGAEKPGHPPREQGESIEALGKKTGVKKKRGKRSYFQGENRSSSRELRRGKVLRFLPGMEGGG